MHLAVVNVAQLRYPLADERMVEFVDAIDPVNRLAEASPGLVWRGTGVAGHSALLQQADGELFVNVSLWTTYVGFHRFTYHGGHGRYLSARRRWFVHLPGPTTALWWVSPEVRPDVETALARLRVLRREGPTRRAFTVLQQWTAEGEPIPRGQPGHRPRRGPRRSP